MLNNEFTLDISEEDYWVTCLSTNLKQPGLEQHNRSVDLINTVWRQIGATILPCTNSSWENPEAFSFSIEFSGRQSGITYSIKVTHDLLAAEIFSKRFEEIESANQFGGNEEVLMGFLSAFKDILSFRVRMANPLGDWEHVCIEPSEDGSYSAWPGDNIASLMLSLYDDLNSALAPEMYTLRNYLTSLSRIAWANGDSDIPISRLQAYNNAYSEIESPSLHDYGLSSKELSKLYFQKFSDPQYPISPSRLGMQFSIRELGDWTAKEYCQENHVEEHLTWGYENDQRDYLEEFLQLGSNSMSEIFT